MESVLVGALSALQYLLGFILLVVAVYVIVRAGSSAHFRTKLEYLRQSMKIRKGEDNGEEEV